LESKIDAFIGFFRNRNIQNLILYKSPMVEMLYKSKHKEILKKLYNKEKSRKKMAPNEENVN